MKVYEWDDSGKKVQLDINEEQLQHMLDEGHPEKVLLIVKEDIRKIFFWKGQSISLIKKLKIWGLEEKLKKEASDNRYEIVIVNGGDEPTEFINTFGLNSMGIIRIDSFINSLEYTL